MDQGNTHAFRKRSARRSCRESLSYLARLFLGISLHDASISAAGTFADADRLLGTYIVGSLLVFVALLVLLCLGLVGGALLVVEGLPALAEDFADLAWGVVSIA